MKETKTYIAVKVNLNAGGFKSTGWSLCWKCTPFTLTYAAACAALDKFDQQCGSQSVTHQSTYILETHFASSLGWLIAEHSYLI